MNPGICKGLPCDGRVLTGPTQVKHMRAGPAITIEGKHTHTDTQGESDCQSKTGNRANLDMMCFLLACVHRQEGYIPSNYITEKASGNLVPFV